MSTANTCKCFKHILVKANNVTAVTFCTNLSAFTLWLMIKDAKIEPCTRVSVHEELLNELYSAPLQDSSHHLSKVPFLVLPLRLWT